MAQAINEFTEKIYKRFLENLRGDEEIPDSLINEIEKLADNGQLTNSEAIFKAYEDWEGSHAKD